MGKKRVIIESVHPLSEKQQTFLADEIKKILAPEKVSCYFALNPDLIGGIKAHFEALVLDDSVRGKWQAIRHYAENQNLNNISVKNIPDYLVKT